MLTQYHITLAALFVILATVLVQSLVAMIAHRRQAVYIPGIIDERLGHESFVFRSHRTFQNSLENTPLMVGTVVVAMLSGLPASMLALISWIYAIARLIHMGLYYAIATEKNPSPRSYFYLVGLIANLVLMANLGWHLLTVS